MSVVTNPSTLSSLRGALGIGASAPMGASDEIQLALAIPPSGSMPTYPRPAGFRLTAQSAATAPTLTSTASATIFSFTGRGTLWAFWLYGAHPDVGVTITIDGVAHGIIAGKSGAEGQFQAYASAADLIAMAPFPTAGGFGAQGWVVPWSVTNSHSMIQRAVPITFEKSITIVVTNRDVSTRAYAYWIEAFFENQ